MLPFIQQLLEKGRQIRPEDEEPEVTPEAHILINVFFELNQWRGSNGMGLDVIRLGDIEAYCHRFRAVLTSWEVQMIKKMDMLYLKHHADRPK